MLLRLPSLILACGLLLAMESKDRENASATPKQEDPFWVAGYSIRTNNADEISGRGRIGNLWRRFIQHNLAASLPNRVDQSLVWSTRITGATSGANTVTCSARASLPSSISVRK